MRYIESPTEVSGAGKDVKLFLAGGITGVEDWQSQVVELLKGSDLTLVNPRRKDWNNTNLEKEPKVIEVKTKLDEYQRTLDVEKIKLEQSKNSNNKDLIKNLEISIQDVELKINAHENRLKELTPERLQIEWEYHHLLKVDAIMFWFPFGSLCPIALFELGSWINRPKPLFIGCDPDYNRKRDVEIQTRLARPRDKVHSSLAEVVDSILKWEANLSKKKDE
jgi:hypothetical protein